MEVSTAFDVSSSAVSPSYRGFTVQGTPSPPPKTHRKKASSSKTIKPYPKSVRKKLKSVVEHWAVSEVFLACVDEGLCWE